MWHDAPRRELRLIGNNTDDLTEVQGLIKAIHNLALTIMDRPATA